ncbi:hypothetical protein GGS21DRAFT_491828 [Xylaria nigripes]|nr:hypothetical protein GGS21DRAFT_491828 [Xylaria nigripes]
MPPIENPPEGGPGGGPPAPDMQTLFDSIQEFAKHNGFAITRRQGRHYRNGKPTCYNVVCSRASNWMGDLSYHRRFNQQHRAFIHSRSEHDKPRVILAEFRELFPDHPVWPGDLYNELARMRHKRRAAAKVPKASKLAEASKAAKAGPAPVAAATAVADVATATAVPTAVATAAPAFIPTTTPVVKGNSMPVYKPDYAHAYVSAYAPARAQAPVYPPPVFRPDVHYEPSNDA